MDTLETVDLNREEAEKITLAIQDTANDLCDLIVTAWKGRAWKALGYSSWGEYCSSEFEVKLALPKPDRQEFVRQLRSEGMSTRAIGAGLGVDQKTVVNDLKRGEENSSPALVTGTDGKQYSTTTQEKTMSKIDTTCVNSQVPARQGFVRDANDRLRQGLLMMSQLSEDTHTLIAEDILETEKLIQEIKSSLKVGI